MIELVRSFGTANEIKAQHEECTFSIEVYYVYYH